MRLLLIKRDDQHVPISKPGAGVLTGLCLPHVTKFGIPVGYTVLDADRYAYADGSLVPPTPGMVVVGMRNDGLYVVDVDGEAWPIGLKAVRAEGTPLEPPDDPDVAHAMVDAADRLGSS